MTTMIANLGPLETPTRDAIRRLREEDAVRRLWGKDASLWRRPSDVDRIRNRLGWLDVAERVVGEREGLSRLREEVGSPRRVVLLGMGGSSLAPEVLAQVLRTPGCLLTMVDSTAPEMIREVERQDLEGTVIVVSSKSGTTIETAMLARYFLERARATSAVKFVAITDQGTPLARDAAPFGFVRTFLNPEDIGGRYSALSYFGLVPSALCGLDVGRLLDRARLMVESCRREDPDENPGARLGAILGAGALAGRDKITLTLSSGIASLGAWIEQLLAESTGKEGKGLLPVEGELLTVPERYGSDRLFVRIALTRETDAVTEQALDRLVRAGHPVVRITVEDPYDLGAEFFRWETATAFAGFLIGINPFDEPNVQQSKDVTNNLLEMYRQEQRLPSEEPARQFDCVTVFGSAAGDNLEEVLQGFLRAATLPEYAAFLAFAPRSPRNDYALAAMRRAVRDTLRIATVRGFGPRYLHSIGQYFKGGPARGRFVVFTSDTTEDLAIPGETYTFGTLLLAQGLGDVRAMQEAGRRVLHIHLTDAESGLQRVTGALHARFPAEFESGEALGHPAGRA